MTRAYLGNREQRNRKTRLRTHTVPDRWIVGVKKDGGLLKRMAHEADKI